MICIVDMAYLFCSIPKLQENPISTFLYQTATRELVQHELAPTANKRENVRRGSRETNNSIHQWQVDVLIKVLWQPFLCPFDSINTLTQEKTSR